MITRLAVLAAFAGLIGSHAAAQPARAGFAETPHPRAPDYAQVASWAALPEHKGAADLVPAQDPTPEARSDAGVDVFYIHPTTDRSTTRWTQPLSDQETNAWTDLSVVSRQASAFNACCRVYAPRYRQASSGAFADPVTGKLAYEFAYQDVKRAFLYYLEHYNAGRPFILAGHSQGALHIYHLIEELIDDSPLRTRMVAAYAVGVPISVGEFGRRYRHVVACATPAQTGCVVSWNTFVAGSDIGGFVKRTEAEYVQKYGTQAGKAILCTNPLTFDLSATSAPASANLGSLVGVPVSGSLPVLIPGVADASCSNGAVFVNADAVAKLELRPLAGGSLHFDDVQLFYENIRRNAVLRADAFATHDKGAAAATGDAAIYAARFAKMMAGKGEQYDLLEPIPGAASFTPLPVAARPSITPDALADARRYAQSHRSTAFLVWRNGAVQTADYFAGVQAQTPLVSKSLAKPLTAIVIGRAIQLGRVRSLDQPVSDFITEWRGGSKAGMKIRQLLNMTSGLLGQRAAPDPDDILNRAYLDPHHGDVLIHDYPLTSPPGTRYDYANAVADLVAIVIERATGEPYARFVSDEVLKPIDAAGGSVWIDRPGGLAHSACCTLAPAETWLRLAILLIDDGRWRGRRLLPRGYVELMRRGSPQNVHYGLGVWLGEPYALRRPFGNPDAPGPRILQSEPYLAKDLFMFDGNADQVVYIIPSRRLIIVRMGDAPPPSPEWDNAVLANTILRGLIEPAS